MRSKAPRPSPSPSAQRRAKALLLTFALSSLSSLSSHAAPAKPATDAVSAANKVEAKVHFNAGNSYFEARLYDKAIKEYLEAYALFPRPDFLFNVGQAFRLKGDKTKAFDYYRQYLLAVPDGKGADEALGYVKQWKAAAEAEEAHQLAERLEQERQDRERVERVAMAAAKEAAAKEAASAPPPTVAPTATTTAVELTRADPPRPASRSKLPLIVGVAVGAVVLVGGVGVGLGVGLSATPPSPTAATTDGIFRPFDK